MGDINCMKSPQKRDDINVLLSIAASLQSISEKPSRFPRRNLTLKETFTASQSLHRLKKLAHEKRHAPSQARSIAKEIEVLLPFYKKTHGEESLLRGLSACIKDEGSIELLRTLGAAKTADLCEKARKLELKHAAIYRENREFLQAVHKTLRESNVTVSNMIKKQSGKNRGTHLQN